MVQQQGIRVVGYQRRINQSCVTTTGDTLVLLCNSRGVSGSVSQVADTRELIPCDCCDTAARYQGSRLPV